MGQSGEGSVREAIERTVRKPPHEVLFQLGGALAILLGIVVFVVQLTQGASGNLFAGVLVAFLVDLILGAVLVATGVVVRKNVANGAILGGAISLVLAVFGGNAGLVGGVLGIIGAVVAFLGPSAARKPRG
jgi:hypothetical protein